MKLRLALALLCAVLAGPAAAHKPSDSYLQLAVNGSHVEGDWKIHLRDLDDAVGLDGDGDGAITWRELRESFPRVDAYALAHLRLASAGSDCPLSVSGHQVEQLSDGGYVVLHLAANCVAPVRTLALDYELQFVLDPTHRGLLRLEWKGAGVQTGVFAPERHHLEFNVAGGSVLRVFGEYFREGLFHVWSGLDHMLFLAGLFLPAVLRRSHGRWLPVPRLGIAVHDTAIIVTAFTIAHACTLTLAATGAFTLPSRWVESAVALTVLFAGLNNLLPMVYRELYWLSFGFGLIHGAAVAGALIELGLPAQGRVWALLAFNLGVEAAQLSLLALVIPTTFYFRHSVAYRRCVLLPGSAIVTVVGLIWFIERACAVNLGVRLP